MNNKKKTGISKSIIFILGSLSTLLLISVLVLVLRVDITQSRDIENKGTETKEVITSTEIASDIEIVKGNEEIYLNSPESVKLQIVAQSFAKAYFSGNLEDVKLYIVDTESAEVYNENIYNDLQYMILKWNPRDIATQTRIGIQYQFQQNGTDSADYLGLEMIKVSDQWKVGTFYLEK